ncbi:MAG: sigma-54 dependent transcriptional regulator [Gemmatimonadales bacterium]
MTQLAERSTVLLVEDDPSSRSAVRRFLEAAGHAVVEAETVAAARRLLDEHRIDAAVVDHGLPDGDGLAVTEAIRAAQPHAAIVVLTGQGSIDLAVRAVKAGAEHFLTKPVELPALAELVGRGIEQHRQQRVAMASELRQVRNAPDPFLGSSPSIAALKAIALKVKDSDAPVLLEGETGSGKSVLAAWLHRQGARAEHAFVDLNCAGLSRELLDNELFGHAKGAFTGATTDKVGLLEIADRGTVLLDEIGDMDLQVQAKLLKVIEEQRFRRLGDARERQVDVRLVAATNHDLKAAVEAQRFRADLLYRINAITVRVPALRERGSDVLAVARQMLARIGAQRGRLALDLSLEARAAVLAYAWPGNIRELRNVLERGALLSETDQLGPADLGLSAEPQEAGTRARLVSLREIEREHVNRVVDAVHGDVSRAAEILGLSRSAVYERLKRAGDSG